jgi:hypothetical protein
MKKVSLDREQQRLAGRPANPTGSSSTNGGDPGGKTKRTKAGFEASFSIRLARQTLLTESFPSKNTTTTSAATSRRPLLIRFGHVNIEDDRFLLNQAITRITTATKIAKVRTETLTAGIFV